MCVGDACCCANHKPERERAGRRPDAGERRTGPSRQRRGRFAGGAVTDRQPVEYGSILASYVGPNLYQHRYKRLGERNLRRDADEHANGYRRFAAEHREQ